MVDSIRRWNLGVQTCTLRRDPRVFCLLHRTSKSSSLLMSLNSEYKSFSAFSASLRSSPTDFSSSCAKAFWFVSAAPKRECQQEAGDEMPAHCWYMLVDHSDSRGCRDPNCNKDGSHSQGPKCRYATQWGRHEPAFTSGSPLLEQSRSCCEYTVLPATSRHRPRRRELNVTPDKPNVKNPDRPPRHPDFSQCTGAKQSH